MPHETSHRLIPLLEPCSIAVVGASGREGRPGYHTVRAVRALGFEGALYPVTPSYEQIDGLECYASLADVPEPVDLVIVASASVRLETHIGDALKHGARSILAYANLRELTHGDPKAGERLRNRVREAQVPLAGPYSIGYVNLSKNRAAAWLEPDPKLLHRGGIATIVQSGATYSYTMISEPRAGFTLNVHPGQELDLTVADYMDYALSSPETRVIGLFLEAVRDPAGFRAALEKADQTGVPVVVLHVGRSAAGARHVLSHAGKLAGSTSALDAVFRHHGVFRVDTMEEWWASLLLFDTEPRPSAGDVVAMADSGGQRALIADHATKIGLPWTPITKKTRDRLTETLDPTLNPENPLDFWGGEPDWQARCEQQLRALTSDPGAGICVVFTDLSVTDTDPVPLSLAKICRKVAGETALPLIAAQYTARHFHPEAIHLLTEAGIPVLDGSREALLAIKNALDFRDRQVAGRTQTSQRLSNSERTRVGDMLRRTITLDEVAALDILDELGIPVVAHGVAETLKETLEVAENIGYPVALKTAAYGIAHKSDCQGVCLGVMDAIQLESQYHEMRKRLGPRVTVAAMAGSGVELSLGMVRDPQFGPLVMLGSGGVMVEVASDVTFALPPFSEQQALSLLTSLAIAPRLHGTRGEPPVDLPGLGKVISRFSVIAAGMDDNISEIDINPLIAGPWGCVAVDALLVRVHP